MSEPVRAAYERLLRERLEGHKLVAEINPEGMTYMQVQQLIAGLVGSAHTALDGSHALCHSYDSQNIDMT